jgi:hypothetical protein
MKISHFVIAVLLSAALPLTSWSQGYVRELGHETSPASIKMPDSDTGELTMQNCATCQVLRLQASSSTRYVINEQYVSRTEMARFLAQTPPTTIVVMQLKNTNELSRIVARSR